MRPEARPVACLAGGGVTAWLGLVGRESCCRLPPHFPGRQQGRWGWSKAELTGGPGHCLRAPEGRAGLLGLGCGTGLCWNWLTLMPAQPARPSLTQPCAQGGARAGAVGMGAEALAPHLPALPPPSVAQGQAVGGWTGLTSRCPGRVTLSCPGQGSVSHPPHFLFFQTCSLPKCW